MALALLGGVLAVPVARAQGTGSFPFDRFSVTVGSFYQTTDVGLRLDASAEREGTSISLEEDLGFDDSQDLLRFELEWRPFERSQFSAGYYELSRDARRTLDREIEFGDTTFPVSASLAADADTQYAELYYTFWAVKKPQSGLGLSIGAAAFSIDLALSAAVERPGGQGTRSLEESASTDLPVPLLGVQWRYAFTSHWMIGADVRALPSVQIEDYEGSALTYGARLEFRPFRNFGLGAAWTSFNIDVDVERDRFQGSLDYTVEGAQVYARLAV